MAQDKEMGNIKKIREMVESGKIIDALYIEEERVPGAAPSGLKIYLATGHQSDSLRSALIEAKRRKELDFVTITTRPRGEGNQKIGRYVLEAKT
ncbi:MAG: hypothetical protein V1845_01805 [bacterium]